MKMVKNILIKLLLLFLSSQIFLFEIKPYENFYSSKPSGSVEEKLEKLSENVWKISSTAKHPLFALNQESIFEIKNKTIVLKSGYRKLDVLGGIRKDYQNYKVVNLNEKKILEFSFGKKNGTLEIFENFYDNLTLQLQFKLDLLKQDQIRINYFDKGKIKKKVFTMKSKEVLFNSNLVEVIEYEESREDKRYFAFQVTNDKERNTIRVLQRGRGFNLEWELD